MTFLRRRLTRLGPLLALLLLVGQVLAQAHATRHELARGGPHVSCTICIVAHGAGALPAAPQTFVPQHGHDALVVTALPARVARRTLDRPRSRAPPALT